MRLYSEDEKYKLYQGSMLDLLDVIQENSISSIVTDPPYEFGFMGKSWDSTGVAFQKETWEKCLKALKPGGYLLAFGGSRTFHRIAVAIEDAGFEIRDTIMWIYGSGFPKSLDVGKAVEGLLTIGSSNVKDIKKLDGKKIPVTGGWNANEVEFGKRATEYEQIKTDVDYQTEEGKYWSSWGTALKPAYEPVIVARKSLDGNVAENVLKWGVGGINIDGCRVGTDHLVNRGMSSLGVMHDDSWESDKSVKEEVIGRFPSNVILTYDETDFDEVCGGFPDTDGGTRHNLAIRTSEKNSGYGFDVNTRNEYADSGNAARYFYCAKASKRDREEGLYFLESGIGGGMSGTQNQSLKTGSGNERNNVRKNVHPTVKPTTLMQYLIRLVTPKGGTILDPFNGSGSTGKAVMWENKERQSDYFYIGIELEEKYLEISKARIDYADHADKIEEEIWEAEKDIIRPGQVLSMF